MNKSSRFEEEVAALNAHIPNGFRVAILGSTQFWDRNSAETCAEIGSSLATIPDLVLLTGGVEGAGETVGRGFANARRNFGQTPKVVHVLPRGCAPWDYGTTLFAGEDMVERREILGRLAGLYVVVEGGPGTEHEARVAAANDAVLIPVGRSGGHAGALFSRLARASLAEEHAWHKLGDPEATPAEIAASVLHIVSGHVRHDT